ncbi:MAG TPA: GspE/PulE family protein [Candidatus Saccharibacteria bacterium]|nr:type II/IV secretion system protein [Candidatus Saccharibacteria bacterium]MCB9817416.1 type II/IV secretion system protein [Candidatus Nomurabacteria bacterium]HPD98784.1 GspE/PulE family protein [Candidatus Saccharibacteria bacterium]HPR10021.1 GspE/PulE family protein [Candidatus Saccharibacteria bacterium]
MPVLLEDTQKQVEQLLVKNGLIEKAQLDAVHAKAKEKGEPFFQLLVTEEHVTGEELTKAIAQVTRVPYVNLSTARVNPKVLSLLPLEVAERYMAVPLGEMQNRLVVAMLDASNVQAVDFLSNKIGRPLKVYMASQQGIEDVIKQYGVDVTKDVEKALEQKKSDDAAGATKTKSIQTIVQDSPISKALAAIMDYAAKSRASDIHIEPLEKELKIRCRIDGVLREIMKLPKSTEPALISRIKILSNLKIDEHRIPQDGQFSIMAGGKAIDLRIAISPVVWGEQCVIRLLDKSGTSLMLEDMGYSGRALRTIREGAKNPNGMILTSGPTGSGKSTSMYALIQEIKSDEINIVTLEDPVEYKMEGINQIQVNSEVGLTFASGLRSILRQDPDVVMVGEIRDAETASLAVQAALTGHLVLSTLHTNSAAGILPRLLDMGIEPFLIASTVRTVIGQRLVRRLHKPEPTESSPIEAKAITETIGSFLPTTEEAKPAVVEDLGYGDLPLANQNAYTLYKGKDSPITPGGYKGRLGLYEVFSVTEEIQDLIIKHATSAQIQEMAQQQGMITMRQDGYFKALSGRTSIAEVNRVAASDSA